MINNVLPIFISALFCFAPTDAARAEFTVTAEDRTFTYRDELVVPSDFTVAEEIERRLINAPLEQKLELVDVWLGKGADYKTALCYCFPRMEYTVNEIKRSVSIEPVDARVEYSGGRFIVVSEKSGRALDENRLYASIYFGIKYGDTDIAAKTVEVKPTVTRAELEANLALRSSYTTEYINSAQGRAHNVAFAASKFDGIKIPSRSSVSFNETVGARTEENGFKTAKIIVDGKYTDGVGGGVCQASTAVYNAALRAGLKCNANSHSICPSYCEPGLDAMISEFSDLTLYNPTAHDIYISVHSADKRTTVKIFGEPSEYEYVPESVTVETVEPERKEITDVEYKYFDAGCPSGERKTISYGVAGAKSETYLNVYKNGAHCDRYKIRENSYKALPQITAISP